MKQTRLVQIREEILSENSAEAQSVRARLTSLGCYMVNVMASPGAGKTSLILETIEYVRERRRVAVIEADLDSTVDADKFSAVGLPAVQLETGGYCHVDARMTDAALAELDLEATDLIFLENVGNLICTAQSETGAHLNVAILSVPEGDDKPLKYPVMFRYADAVILNKIDYRVVADFDLEAFEEQVRTLNRAAPIFPVSCKTGSGIEAWVAWLEERIDSGTAEAADG
ncbi:MAG: hydrogenase nickel incorporation protein HypB [Spirochaetia bacterium]